MADIKLQQKYAILDRDGTLIDEPQDSFQVDSLDKLRILDGAIEGLKELQSLGYKLVMITNQNGIGTPSFPTVDFERPQQAMLEIFQEAGISFEEVFVCPHFEADNCRCRKPQTTLLDDLMRSGTVDMRCSFVCGDRTTDEELAKNLGLRFLFMKTNQNFYQAIKPLLKNAS